MIWNDGGGDPQARVFHSCASSDPVTLTLDSGSDIHLLTLDAAQKLFRNSERSQLSVLGVSGQSLRADLQGHLVIYVEASDGTRYALDL